MSEATIVVLSDSIQVRVVLAASLPESEGFEIVTIDGAFDADVAATLRRIEALDPAAVVIEPGGRVAEGVGLAGAIEQHQPNLSIVLVAEPAPNLLSQAMRVGVRDVIPPLHMNDDLAPAVRETIELVTRRRTAQPAEPAPAPPASDARPKRVIAVVSPKGGAGKTFVSTNLAVGLAAAAPNDVVLIDADLQFGDVSTALRIRPTSSIYDAAQTGLSDPTTLKLHLESYGGGLFVLAAPERPSDADVVSDADLGRAIDLLKHDFDYIVVDTDGGLGERTLTVLEHATDHVFVCETDVLSVRGLTKAIEALDYIGMTTARRHFVLNRADARVGLDNDDIGQSVGVEFAIMIPSSRSVPVSINDGVPVLTADPASPVGKPLMQLVETFAEVLSPEPTRRRRFGRRG